MERHIMPLFIIDDGTRTAVHRVNVVKKLNVNLVGGIWFIIMIGISLLSHVGAVLMIIMIEEILDNSWCRVQKHGSVPRNPVTCLIVLIQKIHVLQKKFLLIDNHCFCSTRQE